jgi:hypothetical protein
MTSASRRSYTYDPTRQIVMLLWPLLLLNGVLWIVYAHVPFVASIWFLMLLVSIVYMRKTS